MEQKWWLTPWQSSSPPTEPYTAAVTATVHPPCVLCCHVVRSTVSALSGSFRNTQTGPPPGCLSPSLPPALSIRPHCHTSLSQATPHGLTHGQSRKEHLSRGRLDFHLPPKGTRWIPPTGDTWTPNTEAKATDVTRSFLRYQSLYLQVTCIVYFLPLSFIFFKSFVWNFSVHFCGVVSPEGNKKGILAAQWQLGFCGGTSAWSSEL